MKITYSILIVEDDKNISDMVKEYLESEEYIVYQALDGIQALEEFEQNHIDLVLLDLMIPKVDGMFVMKNIRNKNLVPIIILSAKDTDNDKALGLGLGADDYMTKPFSLVELAARVKANIRRTTKYAGQKEAEELKIQYKDLIIQPKEHQVTRKGESVKLTAKEFDILKLLATTPNRVYTKAQIYAAVWQDNYYGDENVINVHMRRLREKLEVNPSSPEYIQTLWGIGYKLGER